MQIDGGLRSLFRKRLPQFDWTSIETGGTGRGIPDSNYCIDGVEGWIEFKRTLHWTAGLRPEQVGWMMRRTRHGGRCFIAIRRKTVSKGVPVDQLWLYSGRDAQALHANGMRAVEPLALYNDAWNWPEIAGILCNIS